MTTTHLNIHASQKNYAFSLLPSTFRKVIMTHSWRLNEYRMQLNLENESVLNLCAKLLKKIKI